MEQSIQVLHLLAVCKPLFYPFLAKAGVKFGIWFRTVGTPVCFSGSFANENNLCYFLFALLDDITLPEWGLFLKERICSFGLFPLKVYPFYLGCCGT